VIRHELAIGWVAYADVWIKLRSWFPDSACLATPFIIYKGVPSILQRFSLAANVMITFTPLSGAARSSRSTPLAYLLQVDDVRILLDCGSPDWTPEASSSYEVNQGEQFHWEEYSSALREYVT
jgi:hypothetical protein